MTEMDATQATQTTQTTQTARTTHKVLAGRLALVLATVATWQLMSRVLGDATIPSLVDLVRRAVEIAVRGDLWTHTGATLSEAAAGLLAGGMIGVLVPIGLYRSPRLESALAPFFAGAMAIPKLALAPILMLWLGIGFFSKLVFVGFSVFFLVSYSMIAGLRAVDPSLVAAARVAGIQRWALARHVLYPSALPHVFGGLKVAVPYAVAMAVVGEMLGGESGLGFYIRTSMSQADTVGIFVGVLVVTLLVVTLNALLERLERRVIDWP
jgi:sulfonate transport system permease protein